MKILVRLPLAWPRAVIAVSILLMLLAGAFIPRLHVSTDRNLLAGTDSDEFKRREKVSEMFGTALVSVVVLSAPTKETAHRAADHLAASLKRHPSVIKDVFHRADIAFFERHGLMFASPATVNQVVDTLTDNRDGLRVLSDADDLSQLVVEGADQLSRQAVPENAPAVEIDKGFRFFENVLADIERWFADPGLARIPAIDQLWEGSASFAGRGDNGGYLTDNDGRSPSLVVLFVQPASNSQAMEVVEPLTDLIRAKARATEQKFRGTRALVSGMPSLQTDELRLVTRDCLVAGIASGLGVLLVFMIAFRSLRVSLFLVLPLGVGLIWSAGFTGALYGHLTMITSYFAAVLFGLGVAFTIHIVARFHEALLAGLDRRQSVEAAVMGAGPGVFVGGATTALAFAAIVFSEFRGFAEMGVISAMGVMLILFANLTLLPAALLLWHPGKDAAIAERAPGTFWASIARSRIVVPALAGILMVAGVVTARGVRFNYAVESMLPGNSEAVEAIMLLNTRTDFSTAYSVSVAASKEDAAALARRFRALRTVSRAETVTDFVPFEQKQKIRTLQGLPADLRAEIRDLAVAWRNRQQQSSALTAAGLAASLDELSDTLSDLSFDAKRAGRAEAAALLRMSKLARRTAGKVKQGNDARAAQLDQYVSGLIARGLTVLSDGLSDSGFGVDDLPETVRGRYVSPDGKHFAVLVFPSGDIGQRDFFYRHVDELLSVDPGITGHVVTHRRFTEMVHRGFVQAVILSFIAVLLLVILDLRTWKGVAMALLPVVLASGCTAFVMYITGFMLNYANIMALPILIGTGVDYGVHLAHRTAQSGSVVVAARTTGRAIALSGITTLIGFGSLILGNHWGVRSLGLLLCIGITFALLGAMVVLPGLFRSRDEATSK